MKNTSNGVAAEASPRAASLDTTRRLKLFKFIYSLRPAFVGVAVKKLLGVKRQPVNFARGTFFIDPCSHFGLTLLEHQDYEEELGRFLDTHLTAGNVFMDVGANEGFFSIVASRIVKNTGRVISVEPQARLKTVLQRNLSLNGATNVTLCPVALSDGCGYADFYMSPDTIGGSSALVKTCRYPVPQEKVSTVTLNRLLDDLELESVDLMKMDIESFEYEAILGSPEAFRTKRIKVLVLELHDWILEKRGKDPNKITQLLSLNGYKIDKSGRHIFAYAE